MRRRLISLILALCLLAAAAVPAQAGGNLFGSAGELMKYLRICIDRLDEEIEFSYTSALDDAFSGHDALRNWMGNCGVLRWTQKLTSVSRQVVVTDIEFYPGMRIIRAWQNGTTEGLTDEEISTFRRAQEIISEIQPRAQTQLELQRAIHDWICMNVTYQEMKWEETWQAGDTSIGALLYGVADCDGYADAFYLLGTLAGLTVGFQPGSVGGDQSVIDHMWNVIEHDGFWYHVDVCWDDMDYAEGESMIRYRYFNLGADMLDDHYWNADISPRKLSRFTNWNIFHYTCGQAGETQTGAYYASIEQAARYAVNQQAAGAERAYVMVDGYYQDGAEMNDAMALAGAQGQWITWTDAMGPYTLIHVLFME